jgi:hypothetical protein
VHGQRHGEDRAAKAFCLDTAHAGVRSACSAAPRQVKRLVAHSEAVCVLCVCALAEQMAQQPCTVASVRLHQARPVTVEPRGTWSRFGSRCLARSQS